MAQKQLFPQPVTGNTDTVERHPLRLRSPTTPFQLWYTRTCSDLLAALAGAAPWQPLVHWAKVQSNFLWCSPEDPVVYKNKATALRSPQAGTGAALRERRSDGWKRTGGRQRSQQRCRSSPNQSARTTCNKETISKQFCLNTCFLKISQSLPKLPAWIWKMHLKQKHSVKQDLRSGSCACGNRWELNIFHFYSQTLEKRLNVLRLQWQKKGRSRLFRWYFSLILENIPIPLFSCIFLFVFLLLRNLTHWNPSLKWLPGVKPSKKNPKQASIGSFKLNRKPTHRYRKWLLLAKMLCWETQKLSAGPNIRTADNSRWKCWRNTVLPRKWAARSVMTTSSV